MMTESDGGAATAGTGDETETETETETEAEIGAGTEIEAELETGSGVIAAGVAIETGAAGSGRQTAACGQLNEARGTSSSELRVHKALQTVACTSLTKPRPIPKDAAQATS